MSTPEPVDVLELQAPPWDAARTTLRRSTDGISLFREDALVHRFDPEELGARIALPWLWGLFGQIRVSLPATASDGTRPAGGEGSRGAESRLEIRLSRNDLRRLFSWIGPAGAPILRRALRPAMFVALLCGGLGLFFGLWHLSSSGLGLRALITLCYGIVLTTSGLLALLRPSPWLTPSLPIAVAGFTYEEVLRQLAVGPVVGWLVACFSALAVFGLLFGAIVEARALAALRGRQGAPR